MTWMRWSIVLSVLGSLLLGLPLGASEVARPILVPFLVDAVRVPTSTNGQLLIYDAGERSALMTLKALRVLHAGEVIVDLPLSGELRGDPRHGEVAALIERLPTELTERHRPRFFAPADAREFSESEIGDRYREIASLLALTMKIGSVGLLMGDRVTLPATPPPGASGELRAHYDFGQDTATITLFHGRVGDAAETTLCVSGPLSGAGVFTCSSELTLDASSHYRAYSESTPAGKTAYTNPIFLRLPSVALSPTS